jgi:hypothetical protein
MLSLALFNVFLLKKSPFVKEVNYRLTNRMTDENQVGLTAD